jgi:hypothetical protein
MTLMASMVVGRRDKEAAERNVRGTAKNIPWRRTGTTFMTRRDPTVTTSTNIATRKLGRSENGRTGCTLIE